MDSIAIVRFTDKDLAFGQALTDLEQWHRTEVDWKRLLSLEPMGFFKALWGGARAGIAGITAYDGVAWVHSVIVLKEFRNRGIGRALMNACMDYVHDRGIRSVKLDAVPEAESFYAKLGFVAEFESARFLRAGTRGESSAVSLGPSDLDEVMDFDRSVTGLDRRRVLLAIHEDNPGLGLVMRSRDEITGYILGRSSPVRTNLGPCVCRPGDADCAGSLIRGAMSKHPDRLYRLCVSACNASAMSLARELGFESMTPSVRMYRGTAMRESDGEFVMISPEKG